jgi:N-acetylmuramoyl-L-alanine amidase
MANQKNYTKSIIGAVLITVSSIAGIFIIENPTVSDYNQPTKSEVNYNSNKLTFAFLHASANSENTKLTAKGIANYHTKPKNQGGLGWSRPGYNDVIETSGNHVVLISYNDDDIVQPSERANGAGEFNRISRHICYIGGLDRNGKAKNTLNAKQDSTLKYLLLDLVEKHPQILIVGHNQVANKSCPCMNVPQKLRSYGIHDRNIWWWNNRYPEDLNIPNLSKNQIELLAKQPD